MLILAVVYLTTQVSGNYLANEREKAEVECEQIGLEHFVDVKDNKMQPEVTKAKLCDRLTITNKDGRLRLAAFGLHNEHIYYNGITEKVLKKDEMLTITLNQTGTYIFHDHLQEEVQGQFIVQ